MSCSLHRSSFVSDRRRSFSEALTEATGRHYFDHKPTSQVPNKPFTEATLLEVGSILSSE